MAKDKVFFFINLLVGIFFYNHCSVLRLSNKKSSFDVSSSSHVARPHLVLHHLSADGDALAGWPACDKLRLWLGLVVGGAGGWPAWR